MCHANIELVNAILSKAREEGERRRKSFGSGIFEEAREIIRSIPRGDQHTEFSDLHLLESNAPGLRWLPEVILCGRFLACLLD